MYALNLSEDSRVLSATYDKYAPKEQPRVDNLPEGDIGDYKYIDGNFVSEPLPQEEPKQEPSNLDKLEAQVMWTAVNTDTLIEK